MILQLIPLFFNYIRFSFLSLSVNKIRTVSMNYIIIGCESWVQYFVYLRCSNRIQLSSTANAGRGEGLNIFKLQGNVMYVM